MPVLFEVLDEFLTDLGGRHGLNIRGLVGALRLAPLHGWCGCPLRAEYPRVPRQKREQTSTEDKRLEVAELRELLPRDLVDHGSSIDLFIGDNVRDGGAGDVAFNALAIEILRETPLRCACAQHLRARVLLGEFLVVEQSVIDKAADRVIRVRRRVLLLDQFFAQRARGVRTRGEKVQSVIVSAQTVQSASSTSVSPETGGLMPRTVFTFSSTSASSAGLSLRYIFAFSRP